jgi:uncharacterized protein (DUF488 family)
MSTVWTLGHSTRAWDEFAALLARHGIEAIADVRRYPASRKHPQFNRDALQAALGRERYVHFPELGGRRKARADSQNTAWRNDSFRGYADYMEGAEFEAGMTRLAAFARRSRTAILCAESVWWRCHRGLISDWLKARGSVVLHIVNDAPASEHPYTAAASIVEGRLSYAGAQPRLL